MKASFTKEPICLSSAHNQSPPQQCLSSYSRHRSGDPKQTNHEKAPGILKLLLILLTKLPVSWYLSIC